MIRAVADTHALIWYVYDDPRLSRAAGDLMDETEAAGHEIAVSSISLVEKAYLIEKHRIDGMALDRVKAILDQDGFLSEVVVDQDVASALSNVPRAQVSDMPDRIIAATGVYLGVPLISRDGKIRASTVRTVW